MKPNLAYRFRMICPKKLRKNQVMELKPNSCIAKNYQQKFLAVKLTRKRKVVSKKARDERTAEVESTVSDQPDTGYSGHYGR